MVDALSRTGAFSRITFPPADRATDRGVVMAGAALIAVPAILFFLAVPSRTTSGLVVGAVRG